MTKRAASLARNSAGPTSSSGVAPAAHRRALDDGAVARLVGADRLGHRRRDPAGRDGVDADAVLRPGDGERLGQLDDAALRGGVGRRVRRAEEGVHRGDVDDRALGLRQRRTAGDGEAHGAGEVDVEDSAKTAGSYSSWRRRTPAALTRTASVSSFAAKAFTAAVSVTSRATMPSPSARSTAITS